MNLSLGKIVFLIAITINGYIILFDNSLKKNLKENSLLLLQYYP